MFKRILLATDGSPDAGQALAYARDLALRDGAQVFVVHAFEPVPSYLGDTQHEKIAARHVSAGREVAESAEQSLKEVGVEVIVEVPRKLTRKQRELLEQLAETENAHVSEQRKSFFEKQC